MGIGIENNLFANYSFTVLSGQTKSSVLKATGSPITAGIENPRLCLVGIFTPAALTSTAMTFETSADGATWVPVYDAVGVALSVTVAPSRYMALSPASMFGLGYIKLVCGSAEGADREIIGRFQVV